MKKTVFILMSFMAVFSTQPVIAANSVSFLPAIYSLLLSEDNATPPPLSTFDDIYPFLLDDCSRCHDARRDFEINTEVIDSYYSARAQIELANPELSALLRKPATELVSHDGGQIPDYAVGESKYNLILKWITDGALL